MDFIWLIVFTAFYVAYADPQEDQEAAILEKDLQEYLRRLTQLPMQTTQNFPASILPNVNNPFLRRQPEEPTDEILFPYPLVRAPFQSKSDSKSFSFASSSASVKRPDGDGKASAKAVAFSSLRDVDAEEHIGDDLESSKKSSTISDRFGTSSIQDQTSNADSAEKGDPYTSKHQQVVETVLRKEEESFSDVYFVAIVAGCSAIGIFGVISAGICFYRLQKSQKAAADVDYPAYGVTGPSKDVISPNGDRKLAQSAQMYHFQLQKQQMIAVEKAGSTKNTSASDVDSEEENEEGDYTVYECPGLASTGEMEVKNPLFHDDSTPVSPPMLPDKTDGHHQDN